MSLIVGLTVVAFGTSSPELAVSLKAAVDDQAGLAMGNVVGSNVFNILGVLGLTGLLRVADHHADAGSASVRDLRAPRTR